jgi:methyl-accepting chemotaxis protein
MWVARINFKNCIIPPEPLNCLHHKEKIMDTPTPSRHIGRKIWFGIAITLSVLILLISVAGLVGAWVVQNTLSDVTVNLLQTVYDISGEVRQVILNVDQGLGEVRAITTEVSQISDQISQNVEDQGLLLLLLPQDKEDKLMENINALQETLSTVQGFLASLLEVYRAIDQIPFVELPKLSTEQVEQAEATLSGIQAQIDTLVQNIEAFRAGAADVISRVTEAADKITAGLDELSSNMQNLDTNLAALQDFAVRMQTTLPSLFALAALVISLFLAWVIYTQVELIRLYVRRWKLLGAPATAPIIEAEQPPASPGEGQS